MCRISRTYCAYTYTAVLYNLYFHRLFECCSPAGVLIIWDRMFGTFAEEKEKVYYGLMHQPKTWNPIYSQFFMFAHLIRRVWSHKGVMEKLRFLFYSPSWTPGHGRMGFVYSEPYPPVSTTQTMYVKKCLSYSKWRMQPWELPLL